jgi:hypothetical protein
MMAGEIIPSDDLCNQPAKCVSGELVAANCASEHDSFQKKVLAHLHERVWRAMPPCPDDKTLVRVGSVGVGVVIRPALRSEFEEA